MPAVIEATSVEEKNNIMVNRIYNYFEERCVTKSSMKKPTKTNRYQQRQKKHERALKKVTELKNKAKQEFQQARHEGKSQKNIESLARNFFDLVHEQSKLKKQSRDRSEQMNAKKARQQCHNLHFWRFTKDLLDNNQASHTEPEFSEEQARNFFTTAYNSQPHVFEQPEWMPSPDRATIDTIQ